MSTLERFGLPTPFGITLLMLGMIFALAPYFGGHDFGVLKVPDFGPKKTAGLKRYGWLGLLVGILLFLPLWPARGAAAFNVRVQFQGRGAKLDCQRLAQARATLKVGGESYKAGIGPGCLADFPGIPAQQKQREARLEISGAPSLVLVTRGPLLLTGAQTLTAFLEDSAVAPRLRIAILPFQVPDSSSKSRLEEFEAALNNRLFNMGQTFSSRGPAFKYLEELKVLDDGNGPPMASAAEMTAYWDDSHALQLLRGQIDPTARPLTVHSLVFLGALAPEGRAGLELDMTVTPDAFSRNQDSYSLVMLYSLARDAERLRFPNDVVAAFLAEAFAIGQQLDVTNRDLTLIKSAVGDMLQRLQNGGQRP